MQQKSNNEKIVYGVIYGAILLSSLTLLTVGVPRFLHEFLLIPGTPVLHRIQSNQIVSDNDLALLERSRLDALKYAPLPDAFIDLGATYLAQSRNSADKGESRKLSQMSIDASMRGLTLDPLNTIAWLRVSAAHISLGPQHHDAALLAWRASVAAAPVELGIILQRVHIGIILHSTMTEEDIETLKGQIKIAYRWKKWVLKQYGQKSNLIPWMVFLSDPDSEMSKYLSN